MTLEDHQRQGSAYQHHPQEVALQPQGTKGYAGQDCPRQIPRDRPRQASDAPAGPT